VVGALTHFPAGSRNVVIVFSEVMDKASVETAGYVTSSGANLLGAVLADDGMTVTVSFDADAGDGGGGATLTIPAAVLDINGTAYVASMEPIPN
jgi:hypothetical protein